MSQLFIPNDSAIAIGSDGKFTRVWRAFFNDLHLRVGGIDAYTLSEVEQSAFNGAYAEEVAGDVYRARDEAGILPVQVMAVESALIVLREELAGLQAVESNVIAMREELANLQAEIANALNRIDELAQISVELDGLKSGTVVI